MAEPLAGKRLLIVEEALKDFVGHWFEYVRAVADLNRADGVEVVVVSHSRTSEALRRELGAHPLFGKTLWDGDYNRGWPPLRKLNFLRHNWLVYRTMRKFLREHGPFDCIFVPTVVVHHVFAWNWLWRRQRTSIGRLVLLVRNSMATYAEGSTTPRFKITARPFALGIRSLADGIARGEIVFATDSDRLAEEYRLLTGIAPAVFPSPRVAAPATLATPDPQQPPLFASLGPARLEKGVDVFQQAIARYLADPNNLPARFAIQWPSPIIDAAGEPYLPDPALAASGKVSFLTEPFDSEGYDALVAATGCMVLPYRREAYFARISGVAVEAVTSGIPVISTADTWTSDLVETAGAGLAVPDGDPAALAEAMATIARDFSSYRAAARNRQGAARAAHDGKRFQHRLWGTAP